MHAHHQPLTSLLRVTRKHYNKSFSFTTSVRDPSSPHQCTQCRTWLDFISRERAWKRKQMVDDVTTCRPIQFPLPNHIRFIESFLPSFHPKSIFMLPFSFHWAWEIGKWEKNSSLSLFSVLLVKIHSSFSLSQSFWWWLSVSFSQPTHVTKLHALNSFPSVPVVDFCMTETITDLPFLPNIWHILANERGMFR